MKLLLGGLIAFAVWVGTEADATERVAAPAAESSFSFTRTIYLVRHGNYSPGQKDDQDGGSLTSLGIAQARLVAARLQRMSVLFTSITTSTMTRARQSAQVVHESLPQIAVQTTKLLRECTPRSWSPAVLKAEKPEDMVAAEVQLNAAFAQFFIPAKDRDEHDIIVCHGNVIRYFVTKALGVDTQSWLNLSVAHCSLTIIQVTPDGSFRILAVGDIGHIPPNLQSGLGKADPQLVIP